MPSVRVAAALPPPSATVPTAGRTPAGLPLADRVHVPPGRAALVETPPGTLILVTDQGGGYPLAAREILAVLCHGRATPVRLPVGLVTRVPTGSVLDPAAARAAA
jgi:hypothetical protein